MLVGNVDVFDAPISHSDSPSLTVSVSKDIHIFVLNKHLILETNTKRVKIINLNGQSAVLDDERMIVYKNQIFRFCAKRFMISGKIFDKNR